MSSHFLSSHYGGSHHLSSHYGRGVVVPPVVLPGPSSFGSDHAGRLRKIKDDDDAIMAIIVAFLDVKDR